jgi:hypothetical protein
MKMLWINTGNRHQPELRTKTGYKGRTLENRIISKKTNLLITGSHHSGKTRAITKLFESAAEIWGEQIKPYAYTRSKPKDNKPMMAPGESLDDWLCPQAVFICGSAPLSKWIDNEAIGIWWNENNPNEPYKKIPVWKRCEIIAKYLKATRAVLFVDDAHKLTGRKLIIAKQCITQAFRVVIACSDENRLSPSIRKAYLETGPQIIRLNTDVAYDATHVVMWMFVMLLFIAGVPEGAALLAFFEIMKGGRRASKQD